MSSRSYQVVVPGTAIAASRREADIAGQLPAVRLQSTNPRAGNGLLEVKRVAGRTVVTRAVASSPLKLLAPRSGGDAAWIFASTYGGGLLGGDKVRLEVIAGASTRCLLSTQASTKVYRTLGATSCQELNVRGAPNSIIVSAPDPIVGFAGAKFEQNQLFDLARDAGLVSIDWFTSGRRARGERWAMHRYSSSTEVRIDGRSTFRDVIDLDPRDGAIDSAMRMGSIDCFATVLIVGAPLESAAAGVLECICSQPAPAKSRALFAASPIERGAVIRLAARETEAVAKWIRERLSFVVELLGADPWQRKW